MTGNAERSNDSEFWDKVKIAGPSECWEWQGARRHDGYGVAPFRIRGEIGAHRTAYLMSRAGEAIPRGMVIRHACDNPPCVNPAHLIIGTPADNTADMLARGRARKPAPKIGKARTSVSIGEMATICDVHPRTIKNWCERDLIPISAWWRSPSRVIRIRVARAVQWCDERGYGHAVPSDIRDASGLVEPSAEESAARAAMRAENRQGLDGRSALVRVVSGAESRDAILKDLATGGDS